MLISPQQREKWEDRKLKPLERYQLFLDAFPPVFHKWFLKSFPDPTTWFEARLAYARGIAVMSMVGYLVGYDVCPNTPGGLNNLVILTRLGDRHGENILFDSTTGECVHVDFNCLFGHGLTFPTPEKVKMLHRSLSV